MKSRVLFVACAMSLVTAMAANAQVVCGGCINPANSTVPACITLVGHDAIGAPDPRGLFTVTVRDLANNPTANALVRVDVTPATDLTLCGTQQAGLVVSTSAAAMFVEGRTNLLGQFTVSLMGGSNGMGNGMPSLGLGKIYADGVLIGSPTVSVLDLDGTSGVGINDLAVWLADFSSAQLFGRSDYDCNAGVGINDLSVWLAAYGSSASAYGCTP
ncbi:MAG: hypothetical protein ABL977_10410 [Candidatus Eisenbacteria bacterium]